MSIQIKHKKEITDEVVTDESWLITVDYLPDMLMLGKEELKELRDKLNSYKLDENNNN